MENKNKRKNKASLKKGESTSRKNIFFKKSHVWIFFKKANVIVSFVSGLVTIAGIIFVYIEYRNAQEAQIKMTKEKAIYMFDDAQLERSYDYFMELKSMLPEDTTGYSKFYKIAEIQWQLDSCRNENVKKHLEYAKKLHPMPEQNRANEFLKKYELCIQK